MCVCVFVPLGLTGFIALTNMTGLNLSVVLAVFAAQLRTFTFTSQPPQGNKFNSLTPDAGVNAAHAERALAQELANERK